MTIGAVMRDKMWSRLLHRALEQVDSDQMVQIHIRAIYTDLHEAREDLSDQHVDAVVIVSASHNPKPELDLAAWFHERAPELPLLVLVHGFTLELPSEQMNSLVENCSFLDMDSITDTSTLKQAVISVAKGYKVMDPRFELRVQDGKERIQLSPHEQRLLALLREGYTNEAMARQVHLSPRTVESQVSVLYHKLDIPTDDPAIFPRVVAAAPR